MKLELKDSKFSFNERTILSCFPEHEAVKSIKEKHKKLGRKYE